MVRNAAALLLALSALAPIRQTEFTGLTLSTPFPTQVVPPGSPINLSIEVRSFNLTPQVVDLKVVETPRDWQVHFIGEGKVVNAVYLGPDGSRNLNLKVTPPADARLGTYRIVIEAIGQVEGSARLPIELVIGEVFPPEIKLEVDLPVLRGSPTSAFNFRGRVINESDQDMLVSFETILPEGWRATVKQGVGGQELTSLPVEAGRNESITIEVHAFEEVIAGEYPITFRAVSDVASAELQLTAVVSGQPELSIATEDGRLSGRVYSGRTTPLKVLVTNNGTAAAENVRLESSTPARWTVTFEPESLDAVQPGESIEVTANIQPADKAVAGDYILTLRAVPENGSRESAEFRITLLTSTLWGVVGLVLIAAALGVVALAVSRFGRR